jgi:large subunit ribosomal protein L30
MEAPIRTIFVTLKRSFAGTRENHVKILESLGFSRRQQTLELPNTSSIRGAIDKVSGYN